MWFWQLVPKGKAFGTAALHRRDSLTLSTFQFLSMAIYGLGLVVLTSCEAHSYWPPFKKILSLYGARR